MDTLKNNNWSSEQYNAYQAKIEIQHDLLWVLGSYVTFSR